MESLPRLRVLREVALNGSFTAAAHALHLSQPAVSQHISALERDLGARLVDRSTTGATLTPAGEIALRHALRMLQTADAARREIDALRPGRRAAVRVAAFATACTNLLPAAARAFRALHPSVDFDFVECDTDEALERVRHADVEVAIAFDYAAHELPLGGLVARHLADDPLRLVVPHDHPRALTGDPVDLAGLADEAWIGGTGFACRESLRTVCGAAGYVPRVSLDSNRYPTTLALVAAGHGLALVPSTALVDPPAGVAVRLLVPTPPPRRLWAVTVSEPDGLVADLVDALVAELRV